jgi:hypothetical protein
MDMLEHDAMMIRANVARRFIKNKDLPGPVALAMVVAPSKTLLDASLAAAKSRVATRRSAPSPSPVAARRSPAQTPSPPKSQVVTLDELVQAYS